jgi:hypothetical protein
LQPLLPVIQQAAQLIGQALLNALTQLMPSVVQLIQSFAQMLPQLVPIIPPLAQLIVALIQLSAPVIQITLLVQTLMNIALRPFIALVSDIAQYVLPLLTGAVKDVTKPLTGLASDAQTAVSDVKKHFDDLTTWISGLGGKFAQAGIHTWDWIRDTFKTMVNTVIGWWNGLSFPLPTVHIPGTDIDVGGGSIGVPQIPKLALGGLAIQSGLAWVGEKGPELIQMQAGARVISNPDSRALLGGTGGPAAPDHFTADITLRGLDGQFLDKQLVTFQRKGGVLQSVRTGALQALGTAAR